MSQPNDSLSPGQMTPLEKRSSISLAGIFALRMLGLFLILPVFAVYARSLPGASDPLLVGIALGIYGLTQGLLQIPFGIASDRLGRKPVIVTGLLLFAAGSALAASGTTIETVIAGRALQGAGAVSAAVTAMLADSVRVRVLTKAMAMVGSSIGLTFAFSLVASPVLTTWIGVPGLFWLTGILTIIAVGVMIRVVPDVKPGGSAAQNTTLEHKPWPQVIFDPELLRLNTGIFILHIVQMSLFVVLPLQILQTGLELSKHWMLYLPAIGLSFAFMMPSLAVAERYGRMKLLFLGCVLLTALVEAGFLLLPVSLLMLGSLLFIYFVGFNILEASLPSLVSKAAPAADKGLALGVYNTLQSIGLFAGGALGGWISGRFGAQGVYLCSLGLTCCWFVLSLWLREPIRHSDAGEEIRLS